MLSNIVTKKLATRVTKDSYYNSSDTVTYIATQLLKTVTLRIHMSVGGQTKKANDNEGDKLKFRRLNATILKCFKIANNQIFYKYCPIFRNLRNSTLKTSHLW